MSTYIVKIDFQEGAGWEELTNYAGENLVLYRSIKKTQTLHKDYRSTIDTCNFKIESRAAIANSFLIATKNILCEVIKDGSDYFTGIIRPNTNVRINAKTDFLDFKALDNSYKLEFNLVEDIGYYGDRICDPGDTGNSIVHQLLTAAGYVGGNIGALPTISNTILAFEEKRDTATFYEILDNLIFVYGYVFHFDDEGKFQMYEWAKDDAASTDNLTTTNLLNGVNIKKEDIDFDSVFFEYLTQGSITGTIMLHEFGEIESSSTYAPDRIRYNITVGIYDGKLNLPYPTYVPIPGGENRIVSQIFNETYTLAVYRENNARTIVLAPVEKSGLNVSESYNDVEIFAVDMDDDGIKFTLKNLSATSYVQKGSISVQAEYYWTSESNEVYYPARAGAVTNPIEVKSKYAFDDAISEAFAQSLYKMKKDAVVTYIFSSEDNFDIGEYCDLTLADAGIGLAQVRIIKKITTEEFPIIRYIAEGIGTIGGITASVVTVANSNYIALSDIQESIKTVQSVLNGAGLSVPVASTNMQDLSVDVQGLYFTDTELGFFDGSDWTVHIDNTGDFLFKGDADNYVEWDGAKLSVYGDMFLSGDSEIQGSVKIGETLAVAGSINVDDKLLIDGTNNRYAVYTPELGTLKIALGYLGGIAAYNDTQYGLYIADGNVVRFEGGGELVDNDYTIKEDGSITIENGDGDTVARFGSVAAGNIGMVLGFTGADLDSPGDSDRRIYADNDEIGFEQYTAANWSTSNSIKIGGVDTDSIFYPFTQCQGGISTLATEIDAEFFPGGRLVTFEDSFNDQLGIAPSSTTNAVVSNTWKKFGVNSGTGSSGVARGSIVYNDTNILATTNQAVGCWFNKPLEFGDNGHTALNILLIQYIVSGTEYTTLTVKYNLFTNSIQLTIDSKSTAGGTILEVSSAFDVSWNVDHYVSAGWYENGTKVFFSFDDTKEILEFDISGVAGSPITQRFTTVLTDTTEPVYEDELGYLTGDLINPDIFVQHYLNARAWNTDISAEDYLLKAGTNGVIRALSDFSIEGLTLGSIPFIGTDGVVLEDNSDLFWDNTNKRLGIGTSSPDAELEVEGAPGNVLITATSGNPYLQFKESGGGNVIYDFFYDATNNKFGIGEDGVSTSIWIEDGASANQLYLQAGGNVGINTTAPGQIFDVNQGSGNMIADGYDTHSLRSYKENIEDLTGSLSQLADLKIRKWNRIPKVSADELKTLAILEFGQEKWDTVYPEDEYRDGTLWDCPDVELKKFLDDTGDSLREERRALPEWSHKHYGLVAEEIPEDDYIASKNQNGDLCGYSITNYIGLLHGCINELQAQIKPIEGRII